MSNLKNRKLKGAILRGLTIGYDDSDDVVALRKRRFEINIETFDEDMKRIEREFEELGVIEHFEQFKNKIDEAIDYFYY